MTMQLLGQECLGAGWGSAAHFQPKATVGEEVSCEGRRAEPRRSHGPTVTTTTGGGEEGNRRGEKTLDVLTKVDQSSREWRVGKEKVRRSSDRAHEQRAVEWRLKTSTLEPRDHLHSYIIGWPSLCIAR